MLQKKLLLLCLLLPTFLVGGISAQWEHRYFKEVRPLPLDGRSLHWQWNQPEEQPSLVAFGINDHQVKDGLMPGWAQAPLPEGLATNPQALKNFLAKLGAHPAVAFATPTFRDNLGGPLVPTPRIFVRFKHNVTTDIAETILRAEQAGQVIAENWEGIPRCFEVMSSATNAATLLDLTNRLSDREEILFAEPDFCFTAKSLTLPNDPRLDEQWGVHNGLFLGLAATDFDLDLLEAWDLSLGSAQVKIAVIDDGVQKDHPDLPFAMPGTDVTSDGPGDGSPVNVDDNHGTSVTGVIAATHNNGFGVAGASPEATVHAVRAYRRISPTIQTSMSSWSVAALSYCETAGVQITNNSVELGLLTATTTTKYDLTALNGMLHYAAAGNNPAVGTTNPASLNSVYGVIGLGFDGTLAYFSASGANMAFTAPADFILTTDRSGADGYSSPDNEIFQAGTSFATAFASSCAALALSINPSLSPSDVDAILTLTTHDLGSPGFDATYAAGLLNAFGIAWQAALSLSDPSTTIYMQQADQADDLSGAAVAGLDDLDGDGTPDFAFSAPGYDGSAGIDSGRVRVISGKTGLVLTTFEGSTAGENMGSAITNLGDLNADGVADFGISSPRATVNGNAEAGILRVYSGKGLTLLYSCNGQNAGDFFGSSLTPIGDLNSDSQTDFVVGAPGKTVGTTSGVGGIYFISGSNGATISSQDGDATISDGEFGLSLIAVEDMDVDGKEEVLVGAPGSTPGGLANSGRIVVISPHQGLRLAIIDGTAVNDRLGQAVANWGDQTGDGLDDFVAGAPGYSAVAGIGAGIAIVYSSSTLQPINAFFGQNAGDAFGSALVVSNDLDGDTIMDLVIGAPGFDGHQNDCGKIYSYSFASSRPRFELLGRWANQGFGCALAAIGDVDMDGQAEVYVGAQGDLSGSTAGFATVFPAKNPQNQPLVDASLASGNLGASGSGPYDVFLFNSSSGGADRRVEVGLNEDVTYTMLQPLDNPNPANFAIYVYVGLPPSFLSVNLPFGIGDVLWTPCSAVSTNPTGFLVTNSTGLDPCPQLAVSTPTPWHLIASGSLPFPIQLTFYGIIEETATTLGVTNAIVLDIR